MNVIFLPGGPGMGSEYLVNFVKKLDINSNLLVVDFPGDGSNNNVDKIAISDFVMSI